MTPSRLSMSAVALALSAASLPAVADIPIQPVDPVGQQLDRVPKPSRLPAAEVTPATNPERPTPAPKEAKDLDPAAEREIRRAVLRIVNAGFSRGSFEDLVGYLSKTDRQRIGKVADATHEDLDARVASFRKAFRAKYNQDFEFKPEHLKGFMAARAGAEKGTAVVMIGEAPRREEHHRDREKLPEILPPKGNAPAVTDVHTPVTRKTGAADASGVTPAVVPVTLNFINEGNVLVAWRLDLPDTVDGQRLKDALVSTLAALEDAKTDWPDGVGDAYHMAASQFFSALTTSSLASEK